ncbi:allergen Tha p 2-like [Sitodiplosis mosellana]|uniref:allergen Tha p 2-like n=1 Tax=Sitodiplosis mosellana TaxID=263140 RepID=UPI00244468C5|nr:allergen Tha p 2-like [Sitodiplosis mosellana]
MANNENNSFTKRMLKPNTNTAEEGKKSGVGGAVGGAGIGVGIDWIKKSIANSNACSEKAGCHKGYCWAWCGVSLTGGEWCYTTRSYSQSFQYVTCNQDSDCDKCWKCAGSCTL